MQTTHVEFAKRTFEKVAEAFEEFLKPKVIRLYSEAGLQTYSISRRLGIPLHICERWITEEVKRMRDEERKTFISISKAIKRNPTIASEIYHGNRFRSVHFISETISNILKDE